MEPLEVDTLYLAATRPAMFMGVPLSLGAMLLMLAGLIVVIFKNPLYLMVMAPLWLGARELVARDYNAVGVVLLYLRTAGRSVDVKRWGGASVSPAPVRDHRNGHGRGMRDVGG
ncbi:type IV secretion system protein VirB3 [Acidocella sp.]|uniref:type IV secretion system protein VirB3 n=1 Tax=Acidocella sp. TaxID=50710 RepID=UPI00261C277B|nr:type IV secretion system protein VirB3 [Acidocella sp.]MDD2795759.1 type IV secretion system protein VirB3 [Acidocella sp.]